MNAAKKNKKYKLGLVLSGGGARGLAHFGVMKALSEAGFVPDIISGTSAGAIAGLMLSAGKSPEESFQFFSNLRLPQMARFIVSRSGLMVFRGLEARLRKFLRVKSFRDLDIPLVVTVSDIAHSMPVHFHSGDVISCVIASASIPVIFIPRKIDGIDYADGGVFMNLPVRPIRENCERIIAVDINMMESYSGSMSMIRMAERSFHLGIMANTQIDKGMADLLIAPQEMSRYGMFDLVHSKDIYDAGYRYATELIRMNVELLKSETNVENVSVLYPS